MKQIKAIPTTQQQNKNKEWKKKITKEKKKGTK